jgi:phosphatidylinositol-3-phosphatase
VKLKQTEDAVKKLVRCRRPVAILAAVPAFVCAEKGSRVRTRCERPRQWFAQSIPFCLTLVCQAALLLGVSLSAAAQVPLAQHVILVVEENCSFSSVYPTGMPSLVNQGNIYGYADNYYSDVGGSLLDYLWLASGSPEYSFGCNGNGCTSPITDSNIFRLLNNQGLSWKVYAQNYLNAGGKVTTADRARGTYYYRRHNGAAWYSDILSNVRGSQGNIVDLEQFTVDVVNGTLPRYAIIIPDGNYDTHDGSLLAADNFLKNNLASLLTQPDFSPGGSGVLIVTFDNGDADVQGQVYTALMGPNIKSNYVSGSYYQHENTLKTMMKLLGISSYPGNSASASAMSDFFRASAGAVVINSPSNMSIQGTTVVVNAAASELGSKIDHMEIWDNGAKLANIYSSSVSQRFTLGVGQHQMIIRDIGPGPNYAVLHKERTNFVVSASDGVFINAPTRNSTQATLFPVNAYAVESGGNIDHLEVWVDGVRLGNSPKGSTLQQWYTLPTGSHQLTVKDISTGNYQVLHQVTIPISVSSANNVYVNSPANNSTQGATVRINAYAYEQNSSNQLVHHLEVWDKGTKLGNSPLPYGGTSLFINQTYTLAVGQHQLTIEDVSTGTYQVIHKKTINITVQ